MPLARIVSGAQTGVDRGALDAALLRGFPCSGWCPADRKAEDGAIPARFPVTPLPTGGYRGRTIRNVVDSDGTLIIYFAKLDGGTEQTALHCSRRKKPVCLIDGEALSPESAALIAAVFVQKHGIQVLNVAGPRQSREPRAHGYAQALVATLIADASKVVPSVA